MNGKQINSILNKVWNRGYSKGSIGYSNFNRSYFRTATLADIISNYEHLKYSDFEETDGSGIIKYSSYRMFRIKAADWNDAEERQYRYDMAWEQVQKGKKLRKGAQEIYDAGNPKVLSAYKALKPIVAGNKANGKLFNDILLDKFALYPLSLRMIHDMNEAGGRDTSNSAKLYEKMSSEDIDYVIFESGRKVGAENLNQPYDNQGNFNNDPFKGIINVSFNAMSIQSEVSVHSDNLVTRGTQITKLATMDFMDAGVPLDFMRDKKGTNFGKRYQAWAKLSNEQKLEQSAIYKEIQNNQNLLEALIEDGLENLFREFTIVKEIVNGKTEYRILDIEKAGTALRNEMLKRELNDNISEALLGFLHGDSIIEVTPAYHQIRNILYSIADRHVTSQKMPGDQKVQIPSSFIEDIRPVGKKKGLYSSDVLKFYTREEGGKKTNVMEIMIGRWFNSPMSDKDLLEYLNTTEEGQKILRGVAYRIPTQKQNSIDAFVLKQFIPERVW